MTSLGSDITDDELKTLMDNIDLNRDSQIDFDELVTWLFGEAYLEQREESRSLKGAK